MNPIRGLDQKLRKLFPDIKTEIDEPQNPQRSWFLDIRRRKQFVVVEWNPSQGFGVTANPTSVYGEGPDEVFDDRREAESRVITLLELGTNTAPPSPLALKELRKQRKLTQANVAESLGVSQASVAKLEGRDDPRLSTVASIVRAMGGRLVVKARFSDGTEKELRFPKPAASGK